MPFEPKKLYYKIGEVCRIVGVEAYVLRYWEREFSKLAPQKNKGNQRIYRPQDIKLLLEIRRLLYEEGFTIAGARKQLGSGVPAASHVSAEKVSRRRRPASAPAAAKAPRERIDKARKELENILTLLDRG